MENQNYFLKMKNSENFFVPNISVKLEWLKRAPLSHLLVGSHRLSLLKICLLSKTKKRTVILEDGKGCGELFASDNALRMHIATSANHNKIKEVKPGAFVVTNCCPWCKMVHKSKRSYLDACRPQFQEWSLFETSVEWKV
jgi:hypothetical protein